MTVPSLGFTSNELPWVAHVQLEVHVQVAHQRLQSVRLDVSVILKYVEPVILCYMVLQEVLHRLEHVGHRMLMTVGHHKHPVRDFTVVRAGEKDKAAIQMVIQRPVNCHSQCVQAVFGCHDCYEETFMDTQLCAGILGSKRRFKKKKRELHEIYIIYTYWHNFLAHLDTVC